MYILRGGTTLHHLLSVIINDAMPPISSSTYVSTSALTDVKKVVLSILFLAVFYHYQDFSPCNSLT